MRLNILLDNCHQLLNQAFNYMLGLPQPVAWAGLVVVGALVYRLLGNSRSAPSRSTW